MLEADPYGDPQLVELYDLDNPDGPDHAFYRRLADRLNAEGIYDLGCGTGLLTRSLSGSGRWVVGIDPSPTMIDYARTRPGGDAVEWLLGTAEVLPDDGSADLVLCTGNAIMHLGPDELSADLASVAASLRPGATFSFETGNPAVHAWEDWTREATYAERETRFGRLTEWIEVTEVVEDAAGRGELVTFESHNVIDGADRVYRTVLNFRRPDWLVEQLAGVGFVEVVIEGGWAMESFTPNSTLAVVRAKLSELSPMVNLCPPKPNERLTRSCRRPPASRPGSI